MITIQEDLFEMLWRIEITVDEPLLTVLSTIGRLVSGDLNFRYYAPSAVTTHVIEFSRHDLINSNITDLSWLLQKPPIEPVQGRDVYGEIVSIIDDHLGDSNE
jgi:hypothetical protein